MDIGRLASTSLRTLSAVLGGVGGLFENDGPFNRATLVIDDDADVPGGAELLRPGSRLAAIVKMSPTGGAPGFRTVCLKVPDAYGPGADQDFLLASSADGIPSHHAVLPAERLDSRLYSALWIHLAGIEPVVFGLRAEQVHQADVLTEGDRFHFLLSSAVGRFRSIGTVTIESEDADAATTFAGSNAGGGLRALPPALFYRG